MNKIKWTPLLISILTLELLGLISSLLSGNISGIYASLNKPPLAPPGWLFGIIWPILYALMGISLYRILKDKPDGESERKAFRLFALQFLLNILWPVIFFRFSLYTVAFIVIVIMIVLTILVIRRFAAIDKTAALLLLPYLIWILFAAYLNFTFSLLN